MVSSAFGLHFGRVWFTLRTSGLRAKKGAEITRVKCGRVEGMPEMSEITLVFPFDVLNRCPPCRVEK
jgi:hypothetical protein